MTTVVFFPEGAFGPTNNCVGIGEVLKARGARVVFVVEESFAGTLEARGFEERLMRLGPAPEVEEAPGQFWKDFIRDTAPVFRTSTFEQLEGFMLPTWQALADGARYVEPRLKEIWEELAPDVVVEDNVIAFPAVSTGDFPWVRIVSCNPLEIPDPDLPPPYSGLGMDERPAWTEFRAEYARVHADAHGEFDAWVREQGGAGLPGLEWIETSPHANLFLYPEAADYRRSTPLGPRWQRLGSCVRKPEAELAPPPGGGALIYLSLGSLGSADVELMRRLIGLLADTPHRYLVSKGPQHELLELADNMTGEEVLPQTAILPHVDLVITHAGNNTVTECFHFGRPMLCLPIFWDQHDNATRVEETRFGRRLVTYDFEDAELPAAIDELLADAALRARVEEVGRGLRATPGTELAADVILDVAGA